MALIKEPLEVDFFVEPQPLSLSEKAAISEYIKNYKEKKVSNKNEKLSLKKLAAA